MSEYILNSELNELPNYNLQATLTEQDEYKANFIVQFTPEKISELINDLNFTTQEKLDIEEQTRIAADIILDNKINAVSDSIPDVSNLATKNELQEVENSIPDISGLATKAELEYIESEIPDVSNFATKQELQLIENEIPTKASDIGALPDTVNIPSKTSDLTNDSGFITGITSSDVTTALGYTPYNSTNPNNYITANDLPTVNNSTITINQGGTQKGTFTLNQTGNTTIDLDAGGSSSYSEGLGINIANNTISIDSSVVATQTDLQNALDAKQDVLTSENAGNCIEITSSGLPAEYQEVEYLDSTGTQYIDTGVTPTATKLRIVTKCQRLADTKGGNYLGSATTTSPRAGFRLYNDGNNGNLIIQATININIQTPVTDVLDCDITVIQNTSCNYKVNNVSDTVQNNTINLTFDKSIILYGFHFGDNIFANSIPQRFWGFTVYKENILVQNLVPARRKSDSVLGMYDTVSGNFLTNAGTGTFIAGQDVEETTKISFVNDAGYITANDLPTNYVTTDTVQNITAKKTFVGDKAILFKQATTADKLGFTLYNTSNTELAAFEFRPSTIGSSALFNLNLSKTSTNYVGFRYHGTNAINIAAPKVATAGNYYIPINFTDGTNTVTANNVGTVDLSTLLQKNTLTLGNTTITEEQLQRLLALL